MARITPSAGGIGPELEDDVAYKATLQKIDWSVSDEKYGGENRLMLDWLPDGCEPEDTVRDWISLRLGQVKNGPPSKLRQLLNALSGKPSTTEISWFDDETLEWSYDGETAHDKLTEGREVLFEGFNKPRGDNGTRFSITKYKKVAAAAAPAPAAPRARTRPAPQPVGNVAAVNPDEIPF